VAHFIATSYYDCNKFCVLAVGYNFAKTVIAQGIKTVAGLRWVKRREYKEEENIKECQGSKRISSAHWSPAMFALYVH